jgi:S-formylglutathione hydrolase FrmB
MSELTLTIQSRILGIPTDVSFLLPDSPFGRPPGDFYRCGKKFKILWLLHGAGGDNREFLYNTHIAGLAKRREIVVAMPEALNSDYASHPQMFGGYDYTGFFFEELMPMVQGWLPVSSSPLDTYLAGFSMGGAGALLLGMGHPQIFGGIASLGSSVQDPAFLRSYRDLTAAEFRALTSARPKDFPTAYGPPGGGILRKEVNAICKYETVGAYLDSPECLWDRFAEKAGESALPRKVFFGCGDDDKAKPHLLKFKDYAESLGTNGFSYTFVPGYGHQLEVCDVLFPAVFDYFEL